MKVRLTLGDKTIFYYPDLVLICQPEDKDPYFCTQPRLIVEILSESTERIDRRRNDWLPDTVEETGEVQLDSLDCTLTLEEIYADLALLGG